MRIGRLFNPAMDIFLVTANRTAAEISALCELRIRVRDCACYHSAKEEEFTKVYFHSSVNIIGKEIFCFTRFMMLQKLIAEQQLRFILFADADILLFPKIASRLQLDSTAQLHILVPGATYLSMWTAEFLARFVDFMIAFYQRPAAAVSADIRRFGANRKNPGDIKNFIAQFSDMYMLRAFTANSTVRVLLDHPNTSELVRGGVVELTASISLRVAFQNTSTCRESIEELLARFSWRRHRIAGIIISEPVHTRNNRLHPITSIHLQGVACKRMTALFAEAILPYADQTRAAHLLDRHFA
jgi:hypothetical protein